MKYKGMTFQNNLHRSIGRLYAMAILYAGNNKEKNKEARMHAYYLIRWAQKHGADLPEP